MEIKVEHLNRIEKLWNQSHLKRNLEETEMKKRMVIQ